MKFNVWDVGPWSWNMNNLISSSGIYCQVLYVVTFLIPVPTRFLLLIWWVKSCRTVSKRRTDVLRSMMTSWNGNIFRVTGLLCGDPPVTGEFLAQRAVTRSFGVFFDLFLHKQSRGWWFETPTHSLWRHCNDTHSRYPIARLWGQIMVPQVTKLLRDVCDIHRYNFVCGPSPKLASW